MTECKNDLTNNQYLANLIHPCAKTLNECRLVIFQSF